MNLRKIMVVLLSTIVMITSVNLAAVGEAFAAEVSNTEVVIVGSGQCGNKVNWTLDSEGTLTLSGTGETYTFSYDNTNGTVYRNEKNTTTGVTERVSNPFSRNDNIKKVIVGEGITSLGNHLFYDCRFLADVQLAEGITEIGAGTFQKCSILETVQLPTTVTKIGNGAFKEDPALKRLDIPEKVTEISKEMFNECVSLEEVSIPAGVTSIGGRAFRKCISLKEIEFPEGLTELETHTLAYCASLTEVEIPKGVSSIGDYCFYDCDGLTSLELPDAVQFIDASCFEECDNLERMEIPYGITKVENETFYKCRKLREIVIPDTVVSIGDYAFAQCDALEYIDLPASVQEMGNYVFYEDNILKEIVIPDTVVSIGDYAFAQCDALEYIDLPASIQEIGNHVFYEDNILKEVVIPEGVPSIPKYTFTYCEALEKVTIPSSVKTIGNNAFQACIGLKKIVIPEGVETIGKTAFRECRYLEEITLPSTLKEIQPYALFNCHKLKEINLPAGLTTLGEYALYGLSDITEITIPKGISTIEQLTFYGCKKLEHVIFLGDVTSIGLSAFADCSELRTVNLPQTISSIGESAFESCDALAGITLPKNVTKISRYAFRDCVNLKNVSLSEGMLEIAAYAFAGCSQLKTLTVPASVRTFGSNALPDITKIYCTKGSPTETYAKNKGRKYAYTGGSADENLIKGSINNAGTQATWTVDRDSEKMVMTWNGKMQNYTASTQPWKDVRAYITSVEIFGDIAKIGPYTFSKCDYLKELKVYNRNCDLSALDQLPQGVTIYGTKGSAAENFAKENGYAFVDIECEHTYGEGVETKPSTCQSAGEISYTCSICQYVKTEQQDRLAHVAQTELHPADFDYDGLYKVFCQVCGATMESRTIASVGEAALSKTQYVYNGKVQKPEVTVTDRTGALLEEGTDYDIQWPSGCKTPGRYAVKIQLTGDYDDSKTLYFTIVPKKTSSAKAVLYGHDDVKFSWNKVTGASGYLVYYKKGSASKWTSESTTKTYYKKEKLSEGVKYSFKVVPYYKESGKTTKYYDSNQYKSTTVYTLKKITGVKAAKSGTKVKVSWTNINGETGYQISKMTKKSAIQKKPTTVSSSTAKSKTLSATKGKTYYYRVRAYKTVDGKKIYGPWSDPVKYKRK